MRQIQIALILSWGLLQGCSHPPYPRGDVEVLYPLPPRPVLRAILVGERRVQVVSMPLAGGTPMVFVHGSPGDWKAWVRYLDAPALQDRGSRIAVDRPGFGGSGAGDVVPDLRVQAQMLAAAIPPGPPVVLVGHSLGAPLLAWIAIDHPDKVCGMVMVGGSVAPGYEAPRWYNRAAQSALVSWMLPVELVWSNREMMRLQSELRRLDSEWTRLQRPLIVIQGMRDTLVDPRSASYLEARVRPPWLTVVRVPDQGHFVLWNRPEVVIDAMLSLPCWR